MVLTGQDVIIGAVKDLQFGPLVMFGAGGVEVEGLQDVAFGLAPISEDEAGYILSKTWAGRRLEGFRNLKPADRQAAIKALCSLAQLAADLPQAGRNRKLIPYASLEQGNGVMAVDARPSDDIMRNQKAGTNDRIWYIIQR
jgi:acetyltransferase